MSHVGLFGRRKEAPPSPPSPRPKIRRDVIDLICETAKSQHPHEFGAVLRAEKGVITELLVVPGTVSGRSHAIFHLSMLPIDFSAKGTVHSHPGSVPLPSEADLDLFRRYGNLHIIVAEPYTTRTWRAYNGRGEPVQVDVVD